jgi:hypothetical protein
MGGEKEGGQSDTSKREHARSVAAGGNQQHTAPPSPPPLLTEWCHHEVQRTNVVPSLLVVLSVRSIAKRKLGRPALMDAAESVI